MKVIIILLVFVLQVQNVFGKECRKTFDLTKKCTLRLDEIHPTQFIVGMVSVNIKKEAISRKYKDRTLKKYLKKKWAPSIIGPDGQYYITDRHHLTRSVHEATIPTKEKYIYTKVGADFRGKTFNEFYNFMKINKFVYLKKTGEKARDIKELPKHISNLENDNYRSLSWIIRENGGYEKVDVLFLEFLWADYLYEMGIRITDLITEENILASKKLVHMEEASELPGYISTSDNK
jgi:hypothetical protein